MTDISSKILTELEMLRKLKMIELLDACYSQSKLAKALGVSQSTISRMMGTGKKQTEKSED